MAAKREARLATMRARLVSLHTFTEEMRERSRLRRELNASDAPDAVKTVFGALADPAGFAHDLFVRETQRREGP